MMGRWEKSERILRFISAVEARVAERGITLDPDGDTAKWVSWAKDYAKSIDPIQ